MFYIRAAVADQCVTVKSLSSEPLPSLLSPTFHYYASQRPERINTIKDIA
jgi:hypothetical protein